MVLAQLTQAGLTLPVMTQVRLGFKMLMLTLCLRNTAPLLPVVVARLSVPVAQVHHSALQAQAVAPAVPAVVLRSAPPVAVRHPAQAVPVPLLARVPVVAPHLAPVVVALPSVLPVAPPSVLPAVALPSVQVRLPVFPALVHLAQVPLSVLPVALAPSVLAVVRVVFPHQVAVPVSVALAVLQGIARRELDRNTI